LYHRYGPSGIFCVASDRKIMNDTFSNWVKGEGGLFQIIHPLLTSMPM
jgi:hypothetical protein